MSSLHWRGRVRGRRRAVIAMAVGVLVAGGLSAFLAQGFADAANSPSTPWLDADKPVQARNRITPSSSNNNTDARSTARARCTASSVMVQIWSADVAPARPVASVWRTEANFMAWTAARGYARDPNAAVLPG